MSSMPIPTPNSSTMHSLAQSGMTASAQAARDAAFAMPLEEINPAYPPFFTNDTIGYYFERHRESRVTRLFGGNGQTV